MNIKTVGKTVIRRNVDTVKVDENADDVKAGTNLNSPDFIFKRLETLIGDSLKDIFRKKGLKYPPEYSLIRIFKKEKECEIWVGNRESIDLALTLPVCAMDFSPGPKLKQGDCKTPEGFYSSTELYGSDLWFMWIRLDPGKVDERGECGKGSSFRLWLDYPNSLDKARTKKYLGNNTDPGGAICSHGNCVSVGCVSFENPDFLPVFLLARYHKTKIYGKMQMHVFPFRFTEELKNKYAENSKLIPSGELKNFWSNLEEGYKFINEKKKPFKYSISGGKYVFTGF